MSIASLTGPAHPWLVRGTLVLALLCCGMGYYLSSSRLPPSCPVPLLSERVVTRTVTYPVAGSPTPGTEMTVTTTRYQPAPAVPASAPATYSVSLGVSPYQEYDLKVGARLGRLPVWAEAGLFVAPRHVTPLLGIRWEIR